MNLDNKLLVVDDETNMQLMLSTILSKEGYHVETAYDGYEALSLLKVKNYRAVISDLTMPGMDGQRLLEEMNKQGIKVPVIIMSAYGTVESALSAINEGASDYIFKPFQAEEIFFRLKKVLSLDDLKKENSALKRAVDPRSPYIEMIYKSALMSEVMDKVKKVALSKQPVLIGGESGTGKELVARAIHENSTRKHKPFIAINCGAIPEHLLESELFGHVKGAFTDAIKDRLGIFKAADHGTLFLDEIGELPLNFQVKLLRAIQFEEIKAVGAENSVKVDVRIISATARNIDKMVLEGLFREDLYYRLNVLPLNLPALRERSEDVPVLLDHFLSSMSFKESCPKPQIEPQAIKLLQSYSWPGNVRELENLTNRLVVMASNNNLITYCEVKEALDSGDYGRFGISSENFNLESNSFDLKKAIKKLESSYIKEALEKSLGNRSEASRLLGISYPNLLSKIKDYNLG